MDNGDTAGCPSTNRDLARRLRYSRNVRAALEVDLSLWLTQFDRGELNNEVAEASVIAEYEAHIAALECKVVGKLIMKLDLVKKHRISRSPATA